jgi:hypothetical protein
VSYEPPDSKDVNTEAGKLQRWKLLPGDNRGRYSRLRGLCMCCNELQNV